MVYLTIEGETLVTTADHPFYTVAGERVEAGDLRLGDDIRMASWATGDVESVYIVTQPQPMYNFTVATAHAYFVGEHQWLVHNTGICSRNIAEHSLSEMDEFMGYGVHTLDDFENFIIDITDDFDDFRTLDGGRTAYWVDEGDGMGILLILNPNSPHGGTIFRPDRGYSYFLDID